MMDKIEIINAAECVVFKEEILSSLEEAQVYEEIKTEDSVDLNSLESAEFDKASSISSEAATKSPPPSETAPSSSSMPISLNPSKTKISSPLKRIELLEKHSNDQIRLLTEISNSIKSIKRSLRDVKNYEAKRLKLEEERSKREEETQIMDRKIEKMKLSLEIQKLKLDIAAASTK